MLDESERRFQGSLGMAGGCGVVDRRGEAVPDEVGKYEPWFKPPASGGPASDGEAAAMEAEVLNLGVPRGEFWKDQSDGLSMEGVPMGERLGLNGWSGILTLSEGREPDGPIEPVRRPGLGIWMVGVVGLNSVAAALGRKLVAAALRVRGEANGEEGADVLDATLLAVLRTLPFP